MQKSFVGLMFSYTNTAPIDMSATLKGRPLQLKSVADHAQGLMTLPLNEDVRLHKRET